MSGLKGTGGLSVWAGLMKCPLNIIRTLIPFLQGTTGSSLAKYSLLRSEQLSNTIRYDSPLFSGVRFGLTYTLGADDHDRTISRDIFNDGFGVSLRYENGPLFLTGNFSRQAIRTVHMSGIWAGHGISILSVSRSVTRKVI